jgi:hypothetical protein
MRRRADLTDSADVVAQLVCSSGFLTPLLEGLWQRSTLAIGGWGIRHVV